MKLYDKIDGADFMCGIDLSLSLHPEDKELK